MSVAVSSITNTQAFWLDGNEDHVGDAVSPTIYGRSREQAVLLNAYQKVVTTQESQVLMVHGASGSGKTALVESTLRNKVCADGYFCCGKFFQNSQEPYSAIMTAFSDLCDLVVQSDYSGNTNQLAKKIREALLSRPEEARILSRMINLTPFLGQQSSQISSDSTGTDTAFAKFKSACETFLRTMASSDHPVVLFIDDIQWMEEGSRQLIDMFLNLLTSANKNLSNIMLILAYRDEDATTVNALLKLPASNSIDDIQVDNLDFGGVHEMVCSILMVSPTTSKYCELSDLILTRTLGNPFFVLQFVETIIRENLLTMGSIGAWDFDVAKIKREVMVAETLADLLYRRIEHLSTNMKMILTLASVFGYQFDELTLIDVVSEAMGNGSNAGANASKPGSTTASSTDMTRNCLAEAVKAGFIERLDVNSYKFSHDKLQAAFLSFTTNEEEENLHYLIGQAFLARGDVDASNTYNAAVHLNAAPRLCMDDNQRAKLARINLNAARYCKDMVAFERASDLLLAGMGLLDPEKKWLPGLFDLTFEMTEELAAMELAAGHFDVCKKVSKEVLRRGKSKEMKINALLLSVECRMASNDFDGSILEAKRALQTLNVTEMPKKVTVRHLLPKLISVKRKMARRTDNDILGLPTMRNRAIATAVRLLSHLCSYCLLRDEQNQAVYAALTAMELTLQHGLSPYSSTALTLFGLCELSLFGNHDRAFRYGKLAVSLVEQTKSGNHAAGGPTIGLAAIFLLHWKEPLSGLRDSLALVASNGMENGDFLYGAFCFWQSCFVDTILGQESVGVLADRMQVQYHRASALGGQSVLRRWLQPRMQIFANLLSESTDWKELSQLNGEYLQVDQYIREAEEANHAMLAFAGHWAVAQIAYYFGQYDLAEERYKAIVSMGKAHHLTFSTVEWFWYQSGTHYEQYRASGKRASLRKARRCKRKLERMAAIGCPNVSNALVYLGAKELSFREGLDDTVMATKFDHAIEALGGISYYKGLASEEAGFTFARRGNREQAERYFKQAMDVYYYEWGSVAKFQWLEEMSAEAIDGMEDTSRRGASSLVGDFIAFEGNVSQC